jgi:hypothetical protein
MKIEIYIVMVLKINEHFGYDYTNNEIPWLSVCIVQPIVVVNVPGALLNTINQPNPRIGVSVEISLIGLYFRCLSFGWF